MVLAQGRLATQCSDTAQPPGADAVKVLSGRESPPPPALIPPHPPIDGTLPLPAPADGMPGARPPPYSFANGVKTAREHQNKSWIAAVVVVAVLLAALACCIFTCRRRREAQQARFVVRAAHGPRSPYIHYTSDSFAFRNLVIEIIPVHKSSPSCAIVSCT